MAEYPYVNGVCESCDRLNSGHYSDPLTLLQPYELIARIKERDAEIQSLKGQLYQLTNKLAEQIAQDAHSNIPNSHAV